MVKADGTPIVNPMWFELVGEHIRFTHTTYRAKYRALHANPAMAFLVFDPADPMVYIEVRGKLVEEIADPSGSYYVHLRNRYGDPDQKPPKDKADRVILVMSIEHVTEH